MPGKHVKAQAQILVAVFFDARRVFDEINRNQLWQAVVDMGLSMGFLVTMQVLHHQSCF